MSDFLFVAGHPALNFLNTQKADADGFVETLTAPGSVAAWFGEAGFGDIAATDALLTDALALREAVRALVRAWTTNAPAPAAPLETLNRVLATGASYPGVSQGFAETATPTATAHPLLAVALAAMDLLTHHDKTLVRQCGGTGCVLWFLDTTKNKRRRWCRMEVCGNREKAIAHYNRVREAAKKMG